MLREGRIIINGRLITETVCLVDPTRDEIRIDGRLIAKANPRRVYLLLNKPRGYVTTLNDPEGRATVTDLIKGVNTRVFPVGRLDYDAQGLVLFTNDGDLTQRLLNPKNKIEKIYLVKVKGIPSRKVIEALEEGMYLEKNLKTLPARIRFLKGSKNAAWLKVVIFEGKNHQIKRMFKTFGHHVLKINRVGFSTLRLGGLSPGEYRYLTREEIGKLAAKI